jgi:glyoxylase-like metal-dependent hydrolase (beta-lactamase superfamily II)
VGGDGFTSAEDAAVYLIRFGKRVAIVDAGCGGQTERLAANIRACGIVGQQVDYLLLTHCHFDHTGGAEALRSRYGCAIVVHAADAGALESGDTRRTAASWYGTEMPPLSVDRRITGGEARIDLGERPVTAIHTPGHTPGSVVYLVESDGQRVLFGQDVHGPLHEDFGSDPDAYRQSLIKMADLEADILCEGHYGVFRDAQRVSAFIRSFL